MIDEARYLETAIAVSETGTFGLGCVPPRFVPCSTSHGVESPEYVHTWEGLHIIASGTWMGPAEFKRQFVFLQGK